MPTETLHDSVWLELCLCMILVIILLFCKDNVVISVASLIWCWHNEIGSAIAGIAAECNNLLYLAHVLCYAAEHEIW